MKLTIVNQFWNISCHKWCNYSHCNAYWTKAMYNMFSMFFTVKVINLQAKESG